MGMIDLEKVITGDAEIWFDAEHVGHVFELPGFTVKTLPGKILYADGREVSFAEADEITPEEFESPLGFGCEVRYRFGDLRFKTRVWMPDRDTVCFMELIFESGKAEAGAKILWPLFRSFETGYTVLPVQQGQLVPVDWPVAIEKLPFEGQFCTAGAYMPWFGQVSAQGQAWQLIADTPWDGGYRFTHPAGGPTEELGFYWLPTLGEWGYRRICRLYFSAEGADYNTLAKTYRRRVIESGHFKSLEEKAERNPTVRKLIGSSVVHFGIKTHVAEDSSFFDPEDPEKNNALRTFASRAEEVRSLVLHGAEKFYVHLDGWFEHGYDNKHPDIFPVCQEAGGEEGLLDLARTIQASGNLLGLHDQYRDYYFAGEHFDIGQAVTNADGSHPEHSRWAGGHQTYLCGTLAPLYVRRNFETLFELGLKPDCSYLDVFTCNEPDECFHEDHRATRRDCLDGRLACFAWLNSQGIVPSSEECTDWAMQELVFCHYGPHEFMLHAPGLPRPGIEVPLYNLVYHDCMMLPWPMEPAAEGKEDYMLYALLNAGMPYLIREGAYPGIDGAFATEEEREHALAAKISRAAVVQNLQEKLAFEEMVSHRFLDGSFKRQETVFSDGTTVRVDFEKGTYEILN